MDEYDPYDLSGLRRWYEERRSKIQPPEGSNHLRDIYLARAQQLGLPFVDIAVFRPEQKALDLIPREVAERHNVLPVKQIGHILYVAMSDINNPVATEELRLHSWCQIRGVLAVPEEIRAAIERCYGSDLS